MKRTARQKAIYKELEGLQKWQDLYQGESFLLRTPSKRQKRLIREYWAIEAAKKAPQRRQPLQG